ncbi:CoA transferase subunit A [Actinomadura harenae]|uniref:CoA transferase subunit A n=1 Tax=Actinomadura harenae TaxID=2483351 RepID=UPI0018F43498|nr:CoA transferase subunit A [Actinomadura harenae]
MHHLLTGGDPGQATGKVMTAEEAVGRFVRPGAVVGMGGQNINRCPMALVHEVARQGVGDLTVVGCNLSLPLDLLVAAGLVVRTEQGSGNLERYGTLFAWRRAVEAGRVAVADHSHLTMASRFTAGANGVPFLPTRSLLGSDVLAALVAEGIAQVMDDPWGDGPVVLVRALRPDVSLIHAHRADPFGNVVIEGVTSHEVDMVRASAATVVTVEEIVPEGELNARPEEVTISGAYVSAVVAQPFGAFPTSVYRRYDFAEDEIKAYQALARHGDGTYASWLADHVLNPADFDGYLRRADPGGARRAALTESMRSHV